VYGLTPRSRGGSREDDPPAPIGEYAMSCLARERIVQYFSDAAGVPVVICSRCLAGRVEPVYGRGGGKDLAEAGAHFAGDLAGPKARVLLQLVLAAGGDVSKALAAEAG